MTMLEAPQAAAPILCAVAGAAGSVWPDIVSDLLIALSFLSIPVTLGMIVSERRDLTFVRGVVWAFAALIIGCAALLAVSYLVLGATKAEIEDTVEIVTGIGVSGTAISLWFLAWSIRRLPSNAALRQVNDELAGREQDLKHAFKALEESNRLLLMAEEMARAGYFRFEADGGRRIWSPGLRKIFGVAEGATLPHGDLPLNGYSPADRERVAALVVKALATGEPFAFEAAIERPDGARRSIAARGICERDEGGAVKALFGVCLDLTDRHAVEERLRASEQFLDRAGWIARVGAWEFDPRTGSIAWSAVTRRLHEVGDDYRPTLNAALAFYEAPARRLLGGAIDAALRDGKPWDLELPMTTARGRRIWVRAAGEVEFQDGAPARVFGVVQDITERKKTELEREGVRLALEEARKTAEDARRRAEEASQAKTTFLASMSHEIRTPLNSIVGFTELLLDSTDLAFEDRRKIEQVQAASNSLISIVNDILDFSKIEAGKIELVREALDLPRLLEEVASVAAGAAVHKDLTVELEIADGVPGLVIGDPNRLRQVMNNLLGNAVKFTLFGGVKLVVVPASSDDLRSEIRFEVRDTGIGIAAAAQALLFERFSQLAEGRKRPGSTGLGLAICKSLVEMMGGAIGVESAEGEGACFWFEVPLPAIAAELPAATCQAIAPAAGPARILVADDLAMNRNLARGALEALGHRVDLCDDGAAAVEHVRTGRYDVVLMDLEMPGMDGIEATKRIRALDGPGGAVPIFAVTASVLPQQIQRCLDAGMDGHVGKPFRRAELAALIARIACA